MPPVSPLGAAVVVRNHEETMKQTCRQSNVQSAGTSGPAHACRTLGAALVCVHGDDAVRSLRRLGIPAVWLEDGYPNGLTYILAFGVAKAATKYACPTRGAGRAHRPGRRFSPGRAR